MSNIMQTDSNESTHVLYTSTVNSTVNSTVTLNDDTESNLITIMSIKSDEAINDQSNVCLMISGIYLPTTLHILIC
jgi:hypothetical protein